MSICLAFSLFLQCIFTNILNAFVCLQQQDMKVEASKFAKKAITVETKIS